MAEKNKGGRPRKLPLDHSAHLQALPEYNNLADLDKRIILMHMENPSITKEQISQRIKCSVAATWRFFHSPEFEKINNELVRQHMREIGQLAMLRLREGLNSPQPTIRIATAVKVLRSRGDLVDQAIPARQENKIFVHWGKPEKLVPVYSDNVISTISGEAVMPKGASDCGNNDFIRPSPETG